MSCPCSLNTSSAPSSACASRRLAVRLENPPSSSPAWYARKLLSPALGPCPINEVADTFVVVHAARRYVEPHEIVKSLRQIHRQCYPCRAGAACSRTAHPGCPRSTAFRSTSSEIEHVAKAHNLQLQHCLEVRRLERDVIERVFIDSIRTYLKACWSLCAIQVYRLSIFRSRYLLQARLYTGVEVVTHFHKDILAPSLSSRLSWITACQLSRNQRRNLMQRHLSPNWPQANSFLNCVYRLRNGNTRLSRTYP